MATQARPDPRQSVIVEQLTEVGGAEPDFAADREHYTQ